MTLPGRRPDPDRPAGGRSHLAWFDETDGAYLAGAAIRGHIGSPPILGVVLVPGPHGPSLEIDEASILNRVVVSALAAHGGHAELATPRPGVGGPEEPQSRRTRHRRSV